MLLQAIYAQLGILVFTAFWFAMCKRRAGEDSFIKLATIAILLIGLWMGGVWVYPPLWGLWFIAVGFLFLAALHFRKTKLKSSLSKKIISNLPILGLLPLGVYLLIFGWAGRGTAQGEYVELSPPFESGSGACILSGGLSPLLNFHNFPSDSPRDLAQTYGLDIIKTRGNGFRTKPGHTLDPKPDELTDYAIFDEPVFAPCSGTVVAYENDLPDQPIGGSDKVNTGGNGVVLQCGRYHVHLHHLKRGTVEPQLGNAVSIGDQIGKIGNSGNTIEPHLHLHAETIVKEADPELHGRPVHMRFGEKFMARGDCF